MDYEIGTFGAEQESGNGHAMESKALEALSRAEIDIQIATARRFPRSIVEFKRVAEELACLDEETAASMFYSIPRGGKRIEGASVRLAEVLMYAYGNLRAEAFVSEIGDTHLTSTGLCFDLQRNTAVRHQVKRRITDSKGKRFNDDMIQVTANAANSIALREAVFKVVPRSLWKDVLEKARLTSIGKAMTMEQRRANALAWFNKAGVDEARVLAALERKGIEEVTVDDLITLKGMQSALKEGEASIETLFPDPDAPANGKGTSKAAADLNAALKQQPKGNGKRAEPKPEPEQAPSPPAATDEPDPCPFCGEYPDKCRCDEQVETPPPAEEEQASEPEEPKKRGKKAEPAAEQDPFF